MAKNYHQELDDMPFLEGSVISKYQMLIGCLNCTITLGQFGVHIATFTVARYSQFPRIGWCKAALRVFDYLKVFSKIRIEVDTSHPTHQGEKQKYD